MAQQLQQQMAGMQINSGGAPPPTGSGDDWKANLRLPAKDTRVRTAVRVPSKRLLPHVVLGVAVAGLQRTRPQIPRKIVSRFGGASQPVCYRIELSVPCPAARDTVLLAYSHVRVGRQAGSARTLLP